MSNPPAPKPNQVLIKVNGANVETKYMDVLLDLEVDSSLNLPAMAILRFHDDDLKITDTGPFDIGKSLEVQLPDFNTGSLMPVFKGEITSLEPVLTEELTATLTVRGYDRSHRLVRGRNTKAFVNVTDSDIVSQLVGAAGLSANVQATTVVHEHLFQHNQTNLAFIHERARRIGYEVFVDDRTFYFRKPRGDAGEVTLTWGVNLRAFHPRVSLVGQVNEVLVKGWNVQNKQAITGRASSSASNPQTGLGGWGGAKAQAAFSSAAKEVTVHRPVATQSEADSMAQAILDEINSDFIEAEGMAFGTAALLAGKKAQIQKVGTKFSGTYLVTKAIHRYSPGSGSESGYNTEFSVEGARPQGMADLISGSDDLPYGAGTWYGVVPAIVTNNNDPQGWNRVKLKYPWLDPALESGWSRVIGIGAGTNRGLHWLPEVNDEVLVAFEHGDFNRPYVVGGLWNGSDSLPETTSNAIGGGQVKRRTIKSRLGHTIRFVDESADKYIEIVDHAGKNQIKLDAQNNKLEITCQGDADITTQGNVNVTATGNITMKATGSATLEASQTLTLKGSTVNIN